MRALFGLVLLAGCSYWPAAARAPETHELDGLDAAIREWLLEERPLPRLCDDMLDGARVVVTGNTAELCARDRDSCFVRLHEDPWPFLLFEDLKPVIVLHARLDGRGRQTGVIHETLHLLSFCSTTPHNTDASHRTAGLWEKRGSRGSIEERAQARARAAPIE